MLSGQTFATAIHQSVRIFVGALLLPILLVAGVRECRGADFGDLTVHIIPSTYRDDQPPRDLTLYSMSHHFHVVVTNVGHEKVRLWKEWCSWGYFNLSFEAKDETGAVTIIAKKFPGWDKNFPDWTTLLPGDSMVMEVNFDPSIWENSPLTVGRGHKIVNLRAIYKNSEDEDTKSEGIWVGRVTSNEEAYQIWH